MATLEISVLGPPQFSRDGQPVVISATKAVALLAYLGVTGRSQSREHLIDLLWPDSLPEAGRKNLRNILWTLRKSLDDGLLEADAERLALADPVRVDARTFETEVQRLLSTGRPDPGQFQTLVNLYRGPLLDGLTMADAPDFELWLTTERERLGQLYLQALEELMAVYRAASDWPAVMKLARRALAYDNLQEPMYRALMEAHARQGERAKALRQYDALQAILARELGVEPLPETEALRVAILDGRLPAPAPVSQTAARRPRRVAGLRHRPDLPFVGRRAEWAALDEELRLAAGGQARVVLLTGELGIGKTRLWQVWSEALPGEQVILETYCVDTTQALPFAPLTSLFHRQTCFEQLFKPPSPVPEIWLVELARLLPEIRQYRPGLPASASLPAEEERRRLFEAFTQTLLHLAARPLILFIDDLHWADRATLDWLVYFVDRMRAEPLLLVGAYRPSDAPAELVHLVTGWRREGLVRQLPLDRLTLAETTELIAALGGDVTQAGQLQARSAGNPYFLLELNRASGDGTPAGLTELIQDRLRRLPEAVRQVLQAAAVLESDFDFTTLRRTSGRGEEETLDALDALLEADVLTEQAGHYGFTHPLVASVVHHDLSLARRSFLHRRAAEALKAAHPGRPAALAGQLARHYEQAGRPAQAAAYAEQAAAHALKLAAPAEAVAFYRRAMRLEPTPTRRMGLGQALSLQGELDQARTAFSQALAEFERDGNRREAARACLALATTYLVSGQHDLVVRWAEQALPYLDVQADPEAHARVHFLRGAGNLSLGHSLAEAEQDLLEAARLATENNLLAMAAASRFELGNLLAQRGDLAGALAAFEETIYLARTGGDRSEEVLAYNNLAYHALLAGRLAMAEESIQTGLELADTYSFFVPRQYLYSTAGEIALAQEKFDEAENWFNGALAEAEKYGNQLQAANIRANLGLVARARGELDEALVLLSNARQAVAAIGAPHLQTQIDLWLAELYLQRGEQAAAREALTAAETRLAGSERQGLQAWADRVRATLG